MRAGLVLFAIVACVSAQAQDSASVLARILAEKGAITAAELARVEQAPAADRVTVLASLLEQKGVLTPGEVARLSGPANGAITAAAAQSGASGPATPAAPAGSSTPPAAAPPLTAESRFPVKVYGTILLNAFYNTAATNIQDIPLFTAKQGSDALGNDKNFGMTARQTRFGMRYQASDVAGAHLTGQLELDFLGGKAAFSNGMNMDLPRLRLAFGRLDWDTFSFEAGQDWSIFAPLNPTSFAEYAIPEFSASGNPWIRMPQLRGEFHGRISPATSLLLQLAAIDPNMGDYNTAVFSSGRTPGIGERGRAPGAETRIALTSRYDDRDFTVGLSGHYTHGKNAGTIDGRTLQLPMDSWGVAADYSLPFSRLFNLSGEVYTGRALGIFSVTSGEAILPVGSPGQRGVRSSGGWSQAEFNLNPQWQVNLAYGIDDPVARDLPVGNRARNQTWMGNVIYKYTPHVIFAWEYRRLLTDFHNQPAANERGDHANMAVGYTF